MWTIFRLSWPLFIGMAILMTGHGLLYTLISIRADLEGFSGGLIGLIQSAYYVGFLAASLTAPKLIQHVGHVRGFGALASVASAATLGFVLYLSPLSWVLMRFAFGYCLAGILVISESWLNGKASNDNRGVTLSLYVIASWGMAALGNLLLNIATPSASTLFLLSSILISLAVVPILLSASQAPALAVPESVPLRKLYRISPLGVVATFLCGLVQSGFFATGGLYATRIGFSVAETSLFVTLSLLAGVAAQWPIGALSDRWDRRKVLVLICLLAGFIGLPSSLLPSSAALPIIIATTLFGALLLPVYSLAIAHTNDYLQPEQVIAASGSLILLYGVGSIFGPLMIGALIEAFGPDIFFIANGLGVLLIASYALYRMSRRAPTEEQSIYVQANPAASVVSATLYPEDEIKTTESQ